MIKIEKVEVLGWESAIRGARNPLNSWDRMDSIIDPKYKNGILMGPNDHKLLSKLSSAGADHAKYMRMINVFVDITAPLYWWKEFDTYKVGTVANSCSTMHKIQSKVFTMDDFSVDKLNDNSKRLIELTIETLNVYRLMYNQNKIKDDWWQMIQLLPSSYNQKRTIQMNYQVLKHMYNARKNHKLDEWVEFCKWVETLPYSELITM